MIKKQSYKNKRNKKGNLLSYTSRNLALEMANYSFEKIKKTNSYREIIKIFPKKYIDIFFIKTLFFEYISLAGKITIDKWDNDNNLQNSSEEFLITKHHYSLLEGLDINIKFNTQENSKFKFINKISSFLKIFTKDVNFSYFGTSNIFKLLYYFFVFKINKIFNVSQNLQIKPEDSMIAVNYAFGLDEKRKSDLFWYENSNISSNKILIYFETPFTMLTHDNSSYNVFDYINKKNFKYIKLWKHYLLDNYPLSQELTNKVSTFKKLNLCENYVFNIFMPFIKKINFWYSVFSNYNVKLHFDITEHGSAVIAKQIALEKLNGCSFGTVRSPIHTCVPNFIGYYPNNIFFAWGKLDRKKILETINKIDHVLITGYPYNLTSHKTINEVSKIQKKFIHNGVKFTILLLDNKWDNNNSYINQYIDENYYYNFFKKFFVWLIEDKDLGIIIKPKKYNTIFSSKKLKSLINETINTGRCHIVKDAYNIAPPYYSKISDFTIGLGIFLPSAVLECVANNNKGIILDYPNIKNLESDYFKSNINENCFSNVDDIVKKLKSHKENKNNFQLGNWSDIIEEIDPFRDNNGFQRIGYFIKLISDGYDQNLDLASNIDVAISKYSDYINKKYL